MIAAASLVLVLKTLDGDVAQFSPSDAKATVVVFFSTICPMANDYADRISAIEAELRGRDVRFLLVYPNKNESPADIARNAKGNEFQFPVYRDEGNVVADRLGAQFTPTAVVLDANGLVQYRGAIDDAANPARVKRRYLREAVEAAASGRTPEASGSKVYG